MLYDHLSESTPWVLNFFPLKRNNYHPRCRYISLIFAPAFSLSPSLSLSLPLSPSYSRSRLRFQLLLWWWMNGALRRLRIGLARLLRALPPPNGAAASPRPGAEQRRLSSLGAAFLFGPSGRRLDSLSFREFDDDELTHWNLTETVLFLNLIAFVKYFFGKPLKRFQAFESWIKANRIHLTIFRVFIALLPTMQSTDLDNYVAS